MPGAANQHVADDKFHVSNAFPANNPVVYHTAVKGLGLVRADVAHGEDVTTDPNQRNLTAADVHNRGRALWEIAQRSDVFHRNSDNLGDLGRAA